MRRFFKAQVERAHSYFVYAEQGIPLLDKQGQAAVRAASTLYREILREIERADYDVFARRPVVSTPRKLRVLLRMALAARVPKLRGSARTHEIMTQSARMNSVLPPVSSAD